MEIEISYQKHINVEKNISEKQQIPLSFLDKECISSWRGRRMRETILPLIGVFSGTSWITIGDGNFGTDAYFLEHHGLKVLATSISDATIAISCQLGYIHQYKQMNAECLTEEDNTFDFAFCKEAFHHFPRPYLALYEMLRVSKQGVVLIEPQKDGNYLLSAIKEFIKVKLRKDKSLEYEECGNFIFRINLNELIKIMKAMNYGSIAYRKFNDCYVPKYGMSSIKGMNVGKMLTHIGIGIQNICCKCFMLDYGLAAIVLFKSHISDSVRIPLLEGGFRVIDLPDNPYL